LKLFEKLSGRVACRHLAEVSIVVKLENRFSKALQAILGTKFWCVTLADAVEWRAIRFLPFEPAGKKCLGFSIAFIGREDTLL